MVRFVSLMAMAGGFLMISPSLRDSLATGYTDAGSLMESHSPYSYVVLGLVAAGVLVIFLYKSSQVR